jgi:hypothetical protein
MIHKRVVGVLIALYLSAGVAGCGHNAGNSTPPTMTLDQAKDRLTRYILEAFVELEVWSKPRLTYPDPASKQCDGLKDGRLYAPVDFTVKINLDYYPEQPDGKVLLDKMFDFWDGQRYLNTQDARGADRDRSLTFQNLADKFSVGITEDSSARGNPWTLWASAPCVWPFGTPPPKD